MDWIIKKRKTLFIVDDNLTNLNIARDILSKDYSVITIPSAQKMFEMLNKTIPDIILLDIEMPDISGFDAIKILKADESYKDIPVIFITIRGDGESELKGLDLGAVDYIPKPFAPQLLAKRIEIHTTIKSQKEQLKYFNENLMEMVNIKSKELSVMQDTVISAVSELVECGDFKVADHIERTQSYLKIFIDSLEKSGLYKDELEQWRLNSKENAVKRHSNKLTEAELEILKTTNGISDEIINKIQINYMNDSFLEYAKVFAGTRREKWDGSGYPKGLKEREIPLQGRIMAIVDVYDTLISDRPNKKAFPHKDAAKVIKSGSGTHFDPELVKLFLKNEDEFKNVSTKLEK